MTLCGPSDPSPLLGFGGFGSAPIIDSQLLDLQDEDDVASQELTYRLVRITRAPDSNVGVTSPESIHSACLARDKHEKLSMQVQQLAAVSRYLVTHSLIHSFIDSLIRSLILTYSFTSLVKTSMLTMDKAQAVDRCVWCV